MDFIHELAKQLVIIMLAIAAFGLFVIVIAVVFHCVGKIIFGQRFDDWWDNNFWF